VAEYKLAAPEVIPFTMPDGAPARGMFIKPPGFDPAKKYPVILYIYGGPHAPVIGDRWGGTTYLWHQFMAQQGFLVFYFDDRTSAIPGHKYEVALHRQFGLVELKDHLEGVKYLKSLPYVDGERIGLWGWSGGGYTTCFNMLHAPDVFRVGVAVAPVTDWRDYDTIYTERYMGLPQENEQAYRASSPTHFANSLRGKLLLVHGTADDNVHMQNSLQLAQELIKTGKQFDLLLYPQKTHSISGSVARRHLFTAIADYFKRNL
jgi:dipeptidyl-peptidase-4